MTVTAELPRTHPSGLRNALGKRQLYAYPKTFPRLGYLGVVVLVTIMLYYLYYEEGALTPLMLPYYHMSFQYFLYLLVVSNAIGAFSALIGGLSDRIGRANLTIYGTLVVAVVQLSITGIHSKFGFAAAYCIIGFVEGIILVSTPALMRDFSPQMGRGAAMGFWALGPTMGALAASLVATHTLTHLSPWQDQFIISGLACMGVVVIAFFFLRELSPPLRDQLMVSEQDRALIEAKARGITDEELNKAVSHPFRSMLRLDLISSSLAVSLLLLFYFASVSVLTLYWVVVFGRSTADANGINVWYAAVLSGTLVLFGVLSDWLRVRKPFMLVGSAACIVMTVFLIMQTGHPHTGYYSNVLVIVLLGTAIACAYAPWMAGYTEQVEWHNPALTATGLAVWGWILRIVVALSFLVLPWVITTSTTLVNYQGAAATLQDIQAAVPYAPSTSACASKKAPTAVIADLAKTHQPGPYTLAIVIVACDQSHNLQKAVNTAGGLTNPQVLGLLAYNPLALAIEKGQPVSDREIAAKVGVHSKNLATLLLAEKKLVPAQKASPSEWKRWWWVCIGGQVMFGLLVFTMRGPWSPRAAKRDFEAHERLVEEELKKLQRETTSSPTGDFPMSA
jgi:MFS family permease